MHKEPEETLVLPPNFLFISSSHHRVVPLWGKFGAKNISYHQILSSRDHFRFLREYMALKKLLWSAARTFMRRESLAYIISSISWENAKGLHWQFQCNPRKERMAARSDGLSLGDWSANSHHFRASRTSLIIHQTLR